MLNRVNLLNKPLPPCTTILGHLALGLVEKEYDKHFDYIIITCPTLRLNKTFCNKDWIRHDKNLWIIESKGNLHQ